MTTRILDDSDGDANADVDAVHQVFAAVSHAWAAGDADAFVASYTEEASAILPGFALLGRAAIRDAMGDAFAGPLKGSRRVHQLRSVRFLNDADGDGAGGGGGTAIVLSRSGTALSPRRTGGPWRRGCCHGMPVNGSSTPTTTARRHP
jgi:hypothetical protein